MTVEVVGEEALIVWDAERNREHFIRRGDFRTEAAGFGFLVPTPTKPELAEVPDHLFERLWRHVQPTVVKRDEYDVGWSVCGSMLLGEREGANAELPSVRVLEVARVAGLDAAVLEASDAEALLGWLANHGYASRPELQQWLAHYVEAGWVVTAFKLARDGVQASHDFGSRAVRMSFDAKAPFFPYREPSDQGSGGARHLRVYLAAQGRMAAHVGGDVPWPAQLLSARPVQAPDVLFEGALPPDQLPEGLWLTAFLDRARKRPTDHDLFFRLAEVQSPHEYVVYDVHRYFIPVFLDVWLVLTVVALIVVRRRRMKAGGDAAQR
jgi:hypothetical protein